MHQSYSNDSLCHWNHSILMISLTASSSKVLKEALLVFLLGLAGNHEQKMFQIEQKGNKKCPWEQKRFIKASVAHYGIEWPCMALYGRFTLYGVLWSYMAFYGKISILLDLYRLFSRSQIQIHLVLFFIHDSFHFDAKTLRPSMFVKVQLE